jgi:1-deoxy-D-xylulose-5-phosphate reductoisomerase
MKRLVILGSTGNIGKQALQIVDMYTEKLKVLALTTLDDIGIIKEQIKKYQPLVVGVADEEKAEILKTQVKVKVLSGKNVNTEIAAMKEYDTLVNCLVSLAGIEPTLTAIKNKKNITLANKEALVAAGEIIMSTAKENNVQIIPIDSEHSALLQCLEGEERSNIYQLILTCSGGALRDIPKEQFENITVQQALGHKTWEMGKKITIDTSTLMNKGFEVIEAMWLYDIPPEKIKVVVHPQSIIHSMIEYSDGSIKAQLCVPDMKLPIQYALSYPDRWESPIKRFDFSKNLTFEEPDYERFPCLCYAYNAALARGSLSAAMNAANDFVVEQFLLNKCRFTAIPRVIKKVMDSHIIIKNPTLEEILHVIEDSQKQAKEFLKELDE